MKNRFLLLIIAIAGLLVVFSVDYLMKDNPVVSIETEEVEKVLYEKMNTVEQIFQEVESKSLKDYSAKRIFSELESLDARKHGVAYCIERDGEVIYWSDNTISFSEIDSSVSSSVVKIGNGWFWVISREIKELKVYGLILIKNTYSYENEYIDDHFYKDLGVPDHIQLIVDKEKGSLIHDKEGNYLFSLVPSSYEKDSPGHLILGLDYLILLVFLLFAFFRVVKYEPDQKTGWLLLALLVVLLLLVRYLMVTFEFPEGLYNLKVFDPRYYATSYLLPSLGDLLFLLLSIWFVFYLLVNLYKHKIPKISVGKWGKPLLSILAVLINIGWFLLSHYFLKTLIYNSSITLSLYNFLDLSLYSVLSLFSIFLIIVNYFMLHYFVADWLKKVVSLKEYLTYFIVFSFIVWAAVLLSGYEIHWVTLLFYLFANAVFIVFVFRYLSKYYTRNVIVLLLSAIFLTFFTEYHSENREKQKRKILVSNLDNEHDRIGEYLLRGIEEKLMKDSVLNALMESHLENEPEIFEYIQSEYFNGYFRKYDMQISVCDPKDELEVYLENTTEIYHCYSFFNQMLKEEGFPVSDSRFYFLDNMNGRISYIGTIPFFESDSTREKFLYISLDSKLMNTHLGYPELLLDRKLIEPGPLSDYQYAKYKSGQIIRRSGDFSYPMELTEFFKIDGEFTFKNFGGFNHLIYNVDDYTTILISKQKREFIDLLAQFSYIFAFFYILFILFIFFYHFPDNIRNFNDNFKNKIKLSMILLLFLSLIAIGTGTVYYTTLQFQEKQQETINEKLQSLTVELEGKIGMESYLDTDFQPYLTSLLEKFSNVFYMDMNLYGINGELLASSRPRVFEQDLLGRKMNPEAYKMLHAQKQPRFMHTEIIGNLKYHSAYVPFYNVRGQKLAYLNIPYFTRQKTLQQEIYTLVTVMVNIYVFLIILGVIVAILVSNNITKPLRLIRQRIKKIGLIESNEKIDYASHDEIGELIKEYNRMIDELDENAKKLAQSERETAWREMAKQIAHEIKNPLTPMKLKVQYLKRAWDDKATDFDDRIKKFTDSMISQINTLSGIATEFSNFAKMPRAKNAKISIREQLQNAVSLYENTEHVELSFEDRTEEEYYVYADPDQISRVLNNLIKNAIQAIPKIRKGKIKVRLNSTDHKILISISDNGHGIPDDIKGKLFSPNFTTKTSGMGMGLAITKKIVEDSGGNIWYDTGINKGTTFFVELPVFRKEEADDLNEEE